MLAGEHRALEQAPADRAAAGGHQHFSGAVGCRCGTGDHIPGVMQPALKARGSAKAALERREARIAVHQDVVEKPRRERGGLCFALRAALDQVAHRADHERPRHEAHRILEQRQELEAHLPPAEGKQFDQQHVGARGAPGVEQRRRAAALPRVVDQLPGIVEQRFESDIGCARRRQLNVDLHSGHGRAAAHQRDVESTLTERARQYARALEMADT